MMKFFMTWWWANENSKEVTKRFTTWKQQGKSKILYPISTMVGRNKAFTILEADDIVEIQREVRGWTDIVTYEIIPIMASADLIKLV